MPNAPSGLVPRRHTEMARLEIAGLAPNLPLAQLFARACEIAARTLEVERVGVWLFVDDRAALSCAALFERSPSEVSVGAMLRAADFPTYCLALRTRKAVPAEIADSDPATAELAVSYLTPLGVTSMLSAGIFVDGELVGVVSHEHVGAPREWTTETRDFAGSIADLVALRIQSAEVRELRAAFRTQKARLAALEKMASLKQVAGGIAHDFRNLLSVIIGNAEMLARRGDLPADTGRPLSHMLAAAERGAALSTELIEFARPSDRPPTVLNLADATAEVLPVIQATVGSRHPVRFARPQAVGQVLLSKTSWTRALLNLAVNARDALPHGGEILVQIAPVKVTDGQGLAGHYVMLQVSDSGTGMDEATRLRATEPFFTTKAKGTGLGLSIVRQVVDQAGGLLRIDSAPGKGTTVRAFFPRIGASSGGTSELAVPPGL